MEHSEELFWVRKQRKVSHWQTRCWNPTVKNSWSPYWNDCTHMTLMSSFSLNVWPLNSFLRGPGITWHTVCWATTTKQATAQWLLLLNKSCSQHWRNGEQCFLQGLCLSSHQGEVRWFFLIYLILPAALGPGFTQPLTEMSTRSRKIIFLGSKVQLVHRADNLTNISEPTV
jgi:hypothetical protein